MHASAARDIHKRKNAINQKFVYSIQSRLRLLLLLQCYISYRSSNWGRTSSSKSSVGRDKGPVKRKKFARNFSCLVAFAFRQTTICPFDAGQFRCHYERLSFRRPIFHLSPIVARPVQQGLGRDLAKGFRTDLEAILIIFNMVQFRWHKLDCHHHLIVPIVSERGVK